MEFAWLDAARMARSWHREGDTCGFLSAASLKG